MPLYAGLAETNITPPPGVWMCGYAFRPSGSLGVHDELFARALVLDDGLSMVAIVSMDLIGLDFDLVEQVRQEVTRSTRIPSHGQLLNATHTHGGPNVRNFNAMGSRDPAYIDVLIRKIAGAIRQAADSLNPASLAYGDAPVQIGVNRRQYPGREGVTTIGRNSSGPVDTRVRALAVLDSRRRPMGLLFSHACHPTTIGGDNLLTTADFPGVACDVIRTETGGRVMPFFLQACCGNINPYPRGDFDCVSRQGTMLGQAALEALENAVDLSGEPLESAETSIDLPLLPPPAPEVIRENVERWAEEVSGLKNANRPGHLLHAEGLYDYFKMEERIANSDPMPLARPFAIQCLRLGDMQMLAFPAEMFVQYQLDLEKQAAGALMALAYSNGVHGYVPIAADYPYGGYEVDGAHRYYGSLMFSPECERLIREESYRLARIEQPDWTPYTVG